LKSALNLVEMLFAHISTLSKILGQMRSEWVKKKKKTLKTFSRNYQATNGVG
jgi:hypothetical protein